MAAVPQPVLSTVGTFRTFGETGPLYEVLGSAPNGRKGEMVAIRVIPSGETLDYAVVDLLNDPLAR